MATVADVRFSLPTPHRVVVEHRTADAWGDARLVFADDGRECGAVNAIAAGSTVAATVDCDEHYAVDQAPTSSVALISPDGHTWTHRDLQGEAYGTPGLAPRGGHAVWAQGKGLLTWSDGDFDTRPELAGQAQVITIDEDGRVLGFEVGTRTGLCTVNIRTYAETTTQEQLPVARAEKLGCDEIGLALTSPSQVRGDASGQTGTQFSIHRTSGGRWVLKDPPPVTRPGLDVYSDDAARAVWNQVTANIRGDLVAVGSPDRRHVTAQRYDRSQRRWTPSRVVYDADTPTCRRDIEDSGLLQGATFALRLICGGEPVVLRSFRGESWTGPML
ncbi:hypothetical protein BH10ACT10_BH10ACT10_09910 [soil metagenome]